MHRQRLYLCFMQDIKENKVLTAVDTIFQKGHKSKLSESFQHSVSTETEIIKDYLGIESERQAMFWSMLFGMTIQSNASIDLETFSSYLNTTVLRVFVFQKDFDELVKRKLLYRQKSTRRRRGGESLAYLNLAIPLDMIYSVVNNEPLPKRRMSDLSIYEVLDVVYTLLQQRDDGFIDGDDFNTELENLITENKANPTIRKIINCKLPPLELAILLVLLQQFVEGSQYVEWVKLLRTLLPESQKQIKVRKEWQTGNSKLQKIGFIRFDDDSQFRSDKTITLTTKGMELLGDDKNLFMDFDTPKSNDIIQSTSISEQKLFFNEREQGELDLLSNLLQPNNYDEVVGRLKSNKLKANFTILFSGQPGTGKTESVYQIARSTGRDIKMVDISKTKSKWFGDSEKLIMGIFASYRKLVESSKLTPILLFNEADGIFSSRQTVDESTVSQTQNAMQTCLLQAMEDFEGICICTTNLPMSLKEFERRFLYKITFDKPDSSTRVKILRDKIPFLSDDQILRLSETFNLTGGQIANLSKKFIMNQILIGKYPDMNEVLKLCDSEFLVKSKGRSSIGFKVGISTR